MKHIYKQQVLNTLSTTTFFSKSLLLILVVILTMITGQVFAQGQDVIDIQQKCALANQPFELTVTRLSGNDFNGSTTVTVNGFTIAASAVTLIDKASLRVPVPATAIPTAGNVQVIANTSSKNSQPVTLSVIGPLTVTATPVGCAQATMTASGAPTGGSYRWYRAATGGAPIAEATTATYTTSQAGIYYVALVSANGCESTARVAVTAAFATKQFGGTEFVRQTLEVGKPGTLKLSSVLFDKGHAISVTWQAIKGTETTMLGVTQAPPVGSQASLELASVPAADYFRAIITPNSSSPGCYDVSALDVTSQGIVSLPVELVSFKAQYVAGGINLTWKTASEQDNSGFEVQVSSDGKTFRKIGFVESKVGTTSITQNYNFQDTKALSGISYYRLKQIDFDGKFEFSKIVAISFTGVATSSVYPTLATDEITVKLASSVEPVNVLLSDITGMQVAALANLTDRQLVLPVQHLKSGVYFVTVVNGTSRETIRFLKR